MALVWSCRIWLLQKAWEFSVVDTSPHRLPAPPPPVLRLLSLSNKPFTSPSTLQKNSVAWVRELVPTFVDRGCHVVSVTDSYGRIFGFLERFPNNGAIGYLTTLCFPVMLGLAYSMPDCWLVVSLHPEGPATGQLDQGFPWFSLIPEQMLSWYPNSTLHCMLLMQPSKY
jgi:hypothetical protein